MLGSPTPIGKRPDFNKAQSGGMGWPRLVPVKDQQPQRAPPSDTSQTLRSSQPPSLRDLNDQATSPTTDDGETSETPASFPTIIDEEKSGTPAMSPTTVNKETSKTPAISPVVNAVESSGTVPTEEPATPASIEEPVMPVPIEKPATPVPNENPKSEEVGGGVLAAMGSYITSQISDFTGPRKEEGESSAQGVASKTLKEEGPSETPYPQAIEQVIHFLTDSVPYYAEPKITVQKPSESDVSDISATGTIDEVVAVERLGSTQQGLPQAGGPILVPHIPAPEGQILDVKAPEVGFSGVSALDVPKVAKMKKRSKAIRQTRSIVARETILKALLGRQLAKPTKQALKMLAKGEYVDLGSLAVTQV